MAAGDFSLSSISADPSIDLSDGSDSGYTDFSAFGSTATAIGTEIAAAVTGAPATPITYTAAPAPVMGSTSSGSLLWLVILVIAVIALWGIFGGE